MQCGRKLRSGLRALYPIEFLLSSLKFLEWQKPYQDMISEMDERRLPRRIRAAEWAVSCRLHELSMLG